MAGLPSPRLVIEYWSQNPSTFGPDKRIGYIHDAMKVGWSWYSRFPSNCFFTLRQNSIHNAALDPLRQHVRIWYVNERTGYTAVVFTGRLGEPDSSGEDVIWTSWNYLADLSLSRTGYRVLYPTKLIGTEIAQIEWELARTAIYALLNFVTAGTIENPLGSDGLTLIKTDTRFGVIDVPRLLLMFDLTEIGRANTVNNVTFGITRTAPFQFFFRKNAGVAYLGKRVSFPGSTRDYRFVPGFLALRNDLATIGTTAGGGATEITKTNETSAATYGRRQDVFTIKTLSGLAGATTELDAQTAITARAVKEASQLSRTVLVDMREEEIQPFDGWDIEDTIAVRIRRGRDDISDMRRIVGVRGLQDERGYRGQMMLELPAV
jgi:hypothetical protein